MLRIKSKNIQNWDPYVVSPQHWGQTLFCQYHVRQKATEDPLHNLFSKRNVEVLTKLLAVIALCH